MLHDLHRRPLAGLTLRQLPEDAAALKDARKRLASDALLELLVRPRSPCARCLLAPACARPLRRRSRQKGHAPICLPAEHEELHSPKASAWPASHRPQKRAGRHPRPGRTLVSTRRTHIDSAAACSLVAAAASANCANTCARAHERIQAWHTLPHQACWIRTAATCRRRARMSVRCVRNPRNSCGGPPLQAVMGKALPGRL